MKKNVKNWELEWELWDMEMLVEIVDYQRSKNDWGVEFYSLGDWLKYCGRGLRYVKIRAWLLNNRYVRYNIGVCAADRNEMVSGLCLIGEGVDVCKE